jgi:hypothetical protein
MSLTIKNNDQTFNLPPNGRHIAICCGLIDLGIKKNKNYGSHSPKVLIAWELSHALMPNGKPYMLTQCYMATLNQKSKLKILLEAWREKSFDLEELYEFKLENMLAEPCYLTIDHIPNESGKKYLAKVTNISPLPINIPCPELHNVPITFDLDYYTEENYLALPENIRKKINLSQNIK